MPLAKKPAGKPAPTNPPPARRSAPPVEDVAQDEHQQTMGASKADAFDEVAPGGALGIPPGDWECRILEMVYEKNAKGESVKVTYEATTLDEESAAYGKKSSQWYQIFDKDGNRGKGIGFLKGDLEKLGVDEEGCKFANLKDTLEQITVEQPLVNVKAKQNGQWLNVYLQGLVDDQA